MKKFQQFTYSENEDGSINILKVPIFKLGKHKGTDFNDELIDELIANHKQLKEDDGFLPSVIIGHNDDSGEKEAEGFLDNLLKENGIVYSDIVKVPADTFEESLKKRKYPHRSVEYNPSKNIFSALALLGGTAPHHKLPILEFANDDAHLRIDFAEGDLQSAIEKEDKLRRLRDIWYKMMDFIERIAMDGDLAEADKNDEIKSLITEGASLLNTEAEKFKEDTMKQFSDEDKKKFLDEQAAQFKAQHGVTPEEAIAAMKKLEDEQAKAAMKERDRRIDLFAENLKKPDGKRIAPALVDGFIVPFMRALPTDAPVIQFKEGDAEKDVPALDFFENLIAKTVELAESGKLQVPFEELAEHGGGKGIDTEFDRMDNVSPEDLKIHKQALAFMDEDKSLSYAAAVIKAQGDTTN